MRQFYVACNNALKQAKDRKVFGTIAWLTEAEKHRDRLRGPALARLELSVVEHLDNHFRAMAQACFQLWGDAPAQALVELIRRDGPLSPFIERISRLPVWDKTVQRGSLTDRWADAQDAI